MLYGNKIKLRYYEAKDFDLVSKLRNLPESYDWFYEYEPINSVMTKGWWETSFTKKDEKNFIIADVSSDEAVGTCSLVHIDSRNRKCEFGRFMIDPSKQAGHFGTEAKALILEYAFNHLNLQKVYLEVFCKNEKAIKVYKKFGYVQEGHLKNHIFKNGFYEDIFLMALFQENYEHSHAYRIIK